MTTFAVAGRTWRRTAALLAMAIVAITGARAETPLERGRYLMRSVVACGNCHTPQGPQGPLAGKELAGGVPFDGEPAFTAYSPNITPHKTTGIGGWTDAQLVTAIREGRRPDGTLIGPPMPIGLYRGLSDRDVNAVVAYLRSVPAVDAKAPRSQYKMPLPPSYGPPVGAVADVSTKDVIAYGRYLAGPAAHCMECHSGPDANGVPDLANKLGAGGIAIKGPWGGSVAANLTPTNLKRYTDAQLQTIITTGVRPDGTRLKPPMAVAYYAGMKPADLAAIVAYLRSLPPL